MSKLKKSIKKKRKPKKGFVYLLQNNEGVYKYGCSKNPRERVKNINYTCNDFDRSFNIIASFESMDMYESECLFKWFIWGLHQVGEYFILDENTPELDSVLLKMRDCCS